jgi:hypothetical protein
MMNQPILAFKVVSILFVLISLSGCSSKAFYESTQPKYDENECRKLPPNQYDKCIKQEAKPYEEYKKEREEVINQD